MKTKNRSALGRALLGFFLTLMVTCGGAAVAATVTWSGAGTDANLSTATNWAGGIAPQPDDSLIFDGFARLAPVNDFPAATAFDGITFAPTAGPFALGGNSITLHGDLVDNTPVLVQTVNLGLGLDGNRQIVVTDNGLLMIAGAISGTGFGPTKTGNGTLLLTGTNTFTGPLSINAGVVSVASDANLGGTLASPTPGAIVINGGTLRNTASFTLGANRGIALGPTAGSGAGTFDVTTGTTLTYGGVIANNGSGTGGLTKISFGNLSLAGANTYTGPTLVKNGTLTLNFGDAAAPASNIISPSSTLVLGGATAGLGQNNNATLTLTGKAGANNIQTFAGTNIDIYGSVINVTKGTGGNATLNLGALTHTVGGTVVIPTSPSTTAGTVTTTTSVATTNGILGGWAVAGTPNVQRGITLGTDWATVDASGNIVAYNGYVAAPTYDGTDATLLSKNAAVVADADKNLKFTGPSTPSEMRVDNEGAGTTTDINTVAFTTNGADNTLTIGTGNTLRLGVYGGIFKQNIGNNQLYIGGSGGVQSGNGAQGSSGVGNLTAGGPNPNTPGEIVLTLAHNSGSQGNLNIEANIVDNGTGAVTLIKTGVASVKIDGHNTFSGGIFINQGRFQLAGSEVGSANPDGLGTGRVTIAPGGYLFVSGVNSGTLYTGRGAIPGALANTAQNAPITNDMTISGNGTNQEGIGAIRLGGKAVLSGQITLGGDARIGGASASQANFANTNDTYPAINPDGTTLYVDPSHLISGRITGKYNLDIGSAVSIPTNFVLSNTGNDWSGNTTFISGGGTTKLRLGNDEVIPNGIGKGNLIWGPGNNQGILDLAGHNETVNGLSTALATSAANAIIQNDGFVATIVDDPQNPGLKTYNFTAKTATLTVGDFDQTADFGGVIQDSDTARTVTLPDPNVTGGTQTLTAPWVTAGAKVALTKIGSGVQTLSGANLYTGDTNVNAGTLSVTGSLASNGNVNVNTSAGSAGTLSGTGSVGNVTLAAKTGTNAARLAPGATGALGSIGTLTLNSLTVNGGDLQFDLADPAAVNDQVIVAGAANFTAPSTITPGPSGKAGTYTLLTAGSLTLGVAPTLNAPQFTRSTYALDTTSTPNTIKLILTGGSKSLNWTGNVNNTWDLVQTQNWTDGTNIEKFFNGDTVTFGNGPANRNVILNFDIFPGAVTVDNDANNPYTISGSGSIGGSGALTKSGDGSLTVATNNAYSGGTTINVGAVQVGNGGTLGSLGGGPVSNAGVLIVNRSDDFTFSNVISGTGEVRKMGTDRLTLSGNSSYTGPTNVLAGTVVVTNSGSLGVGGQVTVSPGAAVDVAGNTTANDQNFGTTKFLVAGSGPTGDGALVNSGSVAQQNAYQQVTLAADATFGGNARFDIRGSGSTLDLAGHTLTKAGTNQVNLVDTNVTDGKIVVNGGQLGIEGVTALVDNANGNDVTFNANTILEFYATTGTVSRPMVFNGGGIQIGNGGNNTSTVSSNMKLNGDVTLASLNNTNANSNLTLNGVISETGGPRAITKTGPAVVNLAANNTFSGPVTISGGVLNVASLANGGQASGLGQSSSAASNLVLAGGTLGYNGQGPATTDRLFTLGSGNSAIDSSGGLPVTFTNTGTIPVTGGGPITLTLSGFNTDPNNLIGPRIVDGAVGAAGAVVSVTKVGGGTWTLGGANTYTGATTVNEGTLRVGGSIAGSDLAVNPGATYQAASGQRIKSATLTDATFQITADAPRKVVTIGDNISATPLTMTFASMLDVTTNVLVIDTRPDGEAATLSDVKSRVINAFSASSPGAGDGMWNGFGITSSTLTGNPGSHGVGYGAASVLLGAGGGTVEGTPVDGSAVIVRYTLLGDATLDGAVDFNDLVKLAQNYNVADGTRDWGTGDFTYDGNVDFNDLVKLAQNYNTTLPSAAQLAPFGASFEADLAHAFAVAPEPSALCLFGIAACGLALRRRR